MEAALPNELIDAELARRLDVRKDTIFHWHSEGKLPSYKPPGGRAVRFSWREVLESLAGRRGLNLPR